MSGRGRGPAALVAVLFLLLRPAFAEAPSRVVPSHDVQVVYRVSGAASDVIPALVASDGQPAVLRMAWDASGRRLRVAAEGRPEIAIVDLSRHRADILDPPLHAALRLPMRATDVEALTLSRARFVRRGRSGVVGYACTVWAVRAARGSGTVCMTDDGVALRGEGDVDGRHGGFEAVSVAYGLQPAALFAIPPGYSRLELPRLGLRTDTR